MLLTMWLWKIAKTVRVDEVDSLRGYEQQLLAIAQSLVQETHLRETVDQEDDLVARINCLAASISRLRVEIPSVLASTLESQLPGN